MQYISNSTEETSKIAIEILDTLKQKEESALVIGLSGELGAGKTTFMKAFAEALGVEETIQSPTFVIMKKFSLKGTSKKAQEENFQLSTFNFATLIHIDAYRLESGEDLLKLGWKEIVENRDNIICIEWPEKVSEILPSNYINIKFEHVSENSRKIVLNYE